MNDKQTFAGFIGGGGDRAIDFSGTANLQTRNSALPPFNIKVQNKMVLTANVLKFNFGGTFQVGPLTQVCSPSDDHLGASYCNFWQFFSKNKS